METKTSKALNGFRAMGWYLALFLIGATYGAPRFMGAGSVSAFVEMEEISSEDSEVHVTITSESSAGAVAASVESDDDALWLARAMLSETRNLSELQEVAWVIRNRVESPRWPNTYRGVILQPLQFSAFNAGTQIKAYRGKHVDSRTYYTTLRRDGTPTAYPGQPAHPQWGHYLKVAEAVVSGDLRRPFGRNVAHFFHKGPIEKENDHAATACRVLPFPHPEWAHAKKPIHHPDGNLVVMAD